MATLIFSLFLIYTWAYIQPELLWGNSSLNGEMEKGFLHHSFRDLVVSLSLEHGLAIFGINMAKGFFLIVLLNKYNIGEPFTKWLSLCILLGCGSIKENDNKSFWKRWAIFLGGTLVLIPELTQLSISIFIALAIFSRNKRYFKWSGLLAIIILLFLSELPFNPFVVLAGMIVTMGINSFYKCLYQWLSIPFTKRWDRAI